MKNPTVRNLILSILIFLLVGVAFAYFYYQLGEREDQLKAQLETIQKQIDQEQTAKRLQKIAEESEADREALTQYFLDQAGDSIVFLTTVESLAPTYGVTLKTDSLSEGTDKKTGQAWIDAGFTFSGSRSAVEDFITILENLPYLSELRTVQLTEQEEGAWEAAVTIRVHIKSYE